MRAREAPFAPESATDARFFRAFPSNQSRVMTYALDEIDRRILRELQHNGRISVAALAARVGLSETPCARRIRDMEARGIIQGYACVVDPKALGLSVDAWVQVALDKHAASAMADFTKSLATLPNVVEAYAMTGATDALLRVRCEDMDALTLLLMEKLSRTPAVGSMHSQLVLRALVEKREPPL